MRKASREKRAVSELEKKAENKNNMVRTTIYR
jgi:hypothetical protein